MVEVGLVPVSLGRGVPFLPDVGTRAALRLTDTRRYPTGIMLLTYEIAGDATCSAHAAKCLVLARSHPFQVVSLTYAGAPETP